MCVLLVELFALELHQSLSISLLGTRTCTPWPSVFERTLHHPSYLLVSRLNRISNLCSGVHRNLWIRSMLYSSYLFEAEV